ncbi:hypothetical protein J437_LFUL003737 [Ladona fulva]|uniref:Uncharacterized protein n=1 Tax=Ladona fulva TaxID=123851 RepID=A0A8K0JWX1_LADFU|nr:hypothetical protein J437_LFUL003737 [Ladona fulva]
MKGFSKNRFNEIVRINVGKSNFASAKSPIYYSLRIMFLHSGMEIIFPSSGKEIIFPPSGIEIIFLPSGMEIVLTSSGIVMVFWPSGKEIVLSPSGMEMVFSDGMVSMSGKACSILSTGARTWSLVYIDSFAADTTKPPTGEGISSCSYRNMKFIQRQDIDL